MISCIYFSSRAGGVTAIGEQPVKGLANPQAMGRLCVGEMLTNICWCYLSGGLTSIKVFHCIPPSIEP